MKLYAKYKTNIRDNLKFKLISGDNNPLHYDKKFLANTSFTYPLTQGQLLIILSLLNLKKFKINKNLSEINLIEAKFFKPSIIGELLFFKFIKKQKKTYIKISNYFEDKIIIILTELRWFPLICAKFRHCGGIPRES